MADLTPSRIEPLGSSQEQNSENPGRKQSPKPKPGEKTAAVLPPPIDSDKDETHQLDEQA